MKDSCQKPACYEKTVSLTKEPYDSLGMTVAGGMSSRGWDLPIYVTNVDPDGVVGQEGSIRKGKAIYLWTSCCLFLWNNCTLLLNPVIIKILLILSYYKESRVQCLHANNYSFTDSSICFVWLSLTVVQSSGAHIMAGRQSWIRL